MKAGELRIKETSVKRWKIKHIVHFFGINSDRSDCGKASRENTELFINDNSVLAQRCELCGYNLGTRKAMFE